MRWRFILLKTLFFCAVYTGNAIADTQEAYKSLKTLQNNVRQLASHRDQITQKLETLTSENNKILNEAKDLRYDAAQVIYVQKIMENSNINNSFLISQKSFQNYYLDKRTHEIQSDYTQYQLSHIVERFLKTETLQNEIQKNLDELDTLTLSIKSHLNRINSNHLASSDTIIEIAKLKSQSENLQSFIDNLIGLQKQQSFKALTPPVFNLPVSGVIQSSQSPHNPSLSILTSNHAIVQTPAAGQILFAGEFKNLGKIIIINHGYNYVSILRGFTEITVSQGTILNENDIIGVIGSESWDKKPNKAMLSYELRYNNILTNPLEKMTGL